MPRAVKRSRKNIGINAAAAGLLSHRKAVRRFTFNKVGYDE